MEVPWRNPVQAYSAVQLYNYSQTQQKKHERRKKVNPANQLSQANKAKTAIQRRSADILFTSYIFCKKEHRVVFMAPECGAWWYTGTSRSKPSWQCRRACLPTSAVPVGWTTRWVRTGTVLSHSRNAYWFCGSPTLFRVSQKYGITIYLIYSLLLY